MCFAELIIFHLSCFGIYYFSAYWCFVVYYLLAYHYDYLYNPDNNNHRNQHTDEYFSHDVPPFSLFENLLFLGI